MISRKLMLYSFSILHMEEYRRDFYEQIVDASRGNVVFNMFDLKRITDLGVNIVEQNIVIDNCRTSEVDFMFDFYYENIENTAMENKDTSESIIAKLMYVFAAINKYLPESKIYINLDPNEKEYFPQAFQLFFDTNRSLDNWAESKEQIIDSMKERYHIEVERIALIDADYCNTTVMINNIVSEKAGSTVKTVCVLPNKPREEYRYIVDKAIEEVFEDQYSAYIFSTDAGIKDRKFLTSVFKETGRVIRQIDWYTSAADTNEESIDPDTLCMVYDRVYIRLTNNSSSYGRVYESARKLGNPTKKISGFLVGSFDLDISRREKTLETILHLDVIKIVTDSEIHSSIFDNCNRTDIAIDRDKHNLIII